MHHQLVVYKVETVRLRLIRMENHLLDCKTNIGDCYLQGAINVHFIQNERAGPCPEGLTTYILARGK